MGSDVRRAIDAIGAGLPVLLPTDGVYGLCANPEHEAPASLLYELKGRDRSRPIALLAASVEALLERVPELRGRPEAMMRTLLPGPYTLVLGNPARRYCWLNPSRPTAIGVRVPELPEAARRVLDAVGAVAATSANLSGEPDAARLADVAAEIRAACGAEVDAGELPGTPSTVIDFTGDEPVVLREGAADPGEALGRVRDALS